MESGDKNKASSSVERRFNLNPTNSLCKLAELISNPVSRDIVSRQILLLDNVLGSSPFGFWAQDLTYLNVVLGAMMEIIKKEQQLYVYFTKLLALCAYPPLLATKNQIVCLRTDIKEYFSFLGYLLVTCENIDCKMLVINALWSLLSPESYKLSRTVGIEECQKAIESSALPKIIVNLVEICEGDFLKELLKLACVIVKISGKISLIMMEENILEFAIVKMNDEWNSTEVFFDDYRNYNCEELEVHLELVLLVLTNFQSSEEHKKLKKPSVAALTCLKFALRALIVNNKKLDCNMLLAIILKLFETFPNLQTNQAGLLDDLYILAFATELGTAGTWASDVRFDNDADSFLAKKMLTSSIFFTMNEIGAEHSMRKRNVEAGITKLLNPLYESQWNSEQLHVLQIMFLTVLERGLCRYYNMFMEHDGLPRLVNLFNLFCMSKQYDTDIFLGTLKCVNTSLIINDNYEVMNICINLSLHDILKELMIYILDEKPLNMKHQTILEYILNIFTILVKTCTSNIFHNIDVCLILMERFLKPKPSDVSFKPTLIMHAIYCVWTTGCHNETCLYYFCKKNGVYTLLDLIEESHFMVKIVGLGLLVDLCEEATAIPFLTTWRKGNMNLLKVMIKIFQKENHILGVNVCSKGIIQDLRFPIMGKIQKNNLQNKKSWETSLALTDLNFSCRPKIYAIIQLITQRYKDGVEIANDYYKIFCDNLSVEEQVTKVLCDNFLTLKTNEAWEELMLNLQSIKFEPSPVGNYIITTVTEIYRKKIEIIHNLQKAILEKDKQKENVKEKEFYSMLLDSKLTTAFEALAEMKLIAKATETSYRKSSKPTTNPQTYFIQLHQTTNVNLNTTEIPNQRVTIRSEIMKSEEPEPPELVSPIYSSTSFSNIYDRKSEFSVESIFCEDM